MKFTEIENLSRNGLKAEINKHLDLADTRGSEEVPGHMARAQFYMRELERRWDSRTSKRDLFLEIVVILLIGWEICRGYSQEKQANQNFTDQQAVLKSMLSNASSTATTLTTLNGNIVALQAPVQRNAAAAEKSAVTADKGLHISERAYLSSVVLMPKTPKAGQKLRLITTTTNSGRTLATDVQIISRGQFFSPSVTEATAHDQLYSAVFETQQFKGKPTSSSLLPANTGNEQDFDLDEVNSFQEELFANGQLTLFVFVNIAYKDLFGQKHATSVCMFYDHLTKSFANCANYNSAN